MPDIRQQTLRPRRAGPGSWLSLAAALFAGLLVPGPVAGATATPAAIGVQETDVPGFTPTANQTIRNPTDHGLVQSFLTCAGTDALLHQFDTGPSATVSGLYGQGSGPLGTSADSVFSVVFADGSTSDAAQAYADLTGSAFPSCWAAQWAAITTATSGGLASVVTGYHVVPMATPSVTGARVGGFAIAGTFEALGATLTDVVGVTAIEVGPTVAMLVTVSSGQQFPTTVRTSLTATIAQRMGATAGPPVTPGTTPPSPPPTSAPSTSPGTSSAQSCLRAGVPDATKPILTTAQVDEVVKAKATFSGETTTWASVCVWSVTVPRRRTLVHTGLGATPSGTFTWQVAIQGPLTSAGVAHAAFEQGITSSGVAIDVPGLGPTAALVSASPTPSLLVAAGDYFLVFSSPTAHGATETLVLHGLATLVLHRLGVAPTPQSSGPTSGGPAMPRKHWASDWAGPGFCASNYDQPVFRHPSGGRSVPTVLHGVAACGRPHTRITRSNHQGVIWWRPKGGPPVEFDSAGYQCVEYAERYFYFMTGQPGPWTNGSDIATKIYYTYRKDYPQLGLVPEPKGRVGGTGDYRPSLHAGDIISMWSPGDVVGHVGVVSSVTVHKNSHGRYTGTIEMVDENAGPTGQTRILVRTGRLKFTLFTSFQWVTGLPTS